MNANDARKILSARGFAPHIVEKAVEILDNTHPADSHYILKKFQTPVQSDITAKIAAATKNGKADLFSYT